MKTFHAAPVRTPVRGRSPPLALAARASSYGSRGQPETPRPSYAAPSAGEGLGRFVQPAPVYTSPPAHLHPNCHPAW